MSQAWLVIGGLVAFALLAWYAKRTGAEVQKSIDAAVAEHELGQLKEKSNALRETATAARTSAGSYGDDRLSTTPLPDSDYRD